MAISTLELLDASEPLIIVFQRTARDGRMIRDQVLAPGLEWRMDQYGVTFYNTLTKCITLLPWGRVDSLEQPREDSHAAQQERAEDPHSDA